MAFCPAEAEAFRGAQAFAAQGEFLSALHQVAGRTGDALGHQGHRDAVKKVGPDRLVADAWVVRGVVRWAGRRKAAGHDCRLAAGRDCQWEEGHGFLSAKDAGADQGAPGLQRQDERHLVDPEQVARVMMDAALRHRVEHSVQRDATADREEPPARSSANLGLVLERPRVARQAWPVWVAQGVWRPLEALAQVSEPRALPEVSARLRVLKEPAEPGRAWEWLRGQQA